jgi:hypothetical protein
VLLNDAHSAADVSVASNEMQDRSQEKCNPILDSSHAPSEYKKDADVINTVRPVMT